jgi:hypothetical protein
MTQLSNSTSGQIVGSTYQQDPSMEREDQEAINGTIRSASFTPTRKRSAVVLQMPEALLVFGIYHAGTTGGVDTSQRKGSARLSKSLIR